MKYKAAKINYDTIVLINNKEFLFFCFPTSQIYNRKNKNKEIVDNQIIDTKSWFVGFSDFVLDKEEFSKINVERAYLGF